MTVARDIAAFAARASWGALSPRARHAFKIRVLDSLGCALAATGDRPPTAYVRSLLGDLGGAPTCTLIGGARAPADRAAFHNTALVRYLDFNDAYLAPGETCHPSDNLAPVLAAAQAAGASGETLLAALAASYQVQCRLSDEAPLRARGFDHTTQGACAVAAGVARALGLDVERAANAIAIAATTSPALRVTRTGRLSHWKGLASAHAAMIGTYAALLGSRGISGPPAAFEGAGGFMDALGARFEIDWSSENLERVTATAVKRFNAEIHAQSAIEALLELLLEHDVATSAIRGISVDIFDVAFDIIGGGREGAKTEVRTKEEADHSLPYLLAVAALDRRVLPEQFTPERIARPDVQELLRRVQVRPDPVLSRAFPRELPCHVHVDRQDGSRLSKWKRDYLGYPSRPMLYEDVLGKFRALTEGFVSARRRQGIEARVADLEHSDTERLCELLEGDLLERGP
jgi:2-methylcitrate dehydratase